MNLVFRLLLALWVLGYLLMSCAPILQGHVGAGIVGIVLGGVFFVPWLVGVVILGILVLVTNAPPRRPPGGWR